jgi:hypothetical protein
VSFVDVQREAAGVPAKKDMSNAGPALTRTRGWLFALITEPAVVCSVKQSVASWMLRR